MQRNPSHFGSYDHWSPTGISRASFASIGDTGGFTFSVIVPHSLRPQQDCDGFVARDLVALPRRPDLAFDDAAGEALGADDDLRRDAHEVRVRELHARSSLAVVVEH